MVAADPDSLLSIGQRSESWENATAPSWMYLLGDTIRGMYPTEAGRIRDKSQYDFPKYRLDPVGYCRDVLQVRLTPKQQLICELLLTPPFKVIVESANNIGKSFLAGSLLNWWFDCYDPGIAISTGPTKQHIKDVIWREVRGQRRTSWDYFSGPKAPELYDRADHYSKGYTGENAEAFHGRHDSHILFLVDEAVKVDLFVWQGIKSMFKAGGDHHFLALLNPTDTTSPAYAEASSGQYHLVRLSALEHPNILAELEGKQKVVPQAVDMAQLLDWLDDPEKFDTITEDDYLQAREIGVDVVWPPPEYDHKGALERFGLDGKRRYRRPTPQGMSRVLGIWPTTTPGAVWSELAWQCAMRATNGLKPIDLKWITLPEIGCDVAVGTADAADKTEIFVQCFGVFLEHRVGSGWDVMRTATELRTLAIKWAQVYNGLKPHNYPVCKPEDLPIKIDDNGVGNGVVSALRSMGFFAIGINASTVPDHPHLYPRRRDELWFTVPTAARHGLIDLTRLPKKSLNELKRQAMAVRWQPDIHGRRQVEKKKETKKRLQRSPDSMDALNLAVARAPLPDSGGIHVAKSFTSPTATPDHGRRPSENG